MSGADKHQEVTATEALRRLEERLRGYSEHHRKEGQPGRAEGVEDAIDALDALREEVTAPREG